jgi:hypothetical protein
MKTTTKDPPPVHIIWKTSDALFLSMHMHHVESKQMMKPTWKINLTSNCYILGVFHCKKLKVRFIDMICLKLNIREK